MDWCKCNWCRSEGFNGGSELRIWPAVHALKHKYEIFRRAELREASLENTLSCWPVKSLANLALIVQLRIYKEKETTLIENTLAPVLSRGTSRVRAQPELILQKLQPNNADSNCL